MPYQLPSGREVNIDPNTQGTGIPSNLPGNVPGGYSPAYGGVPMIPDPIASQWQAIGGDLAALPNLFTLGNAYNLFNYDQRLGQIAGTPGFDTVRANQQGILNPDVVNKMAQWGAERGISTGGAPDSPNTTAAYLRSLGLTSLDLQKLGQQQYSDLLGHFQGAAPFDISSFLISPEQQQAANAAANVSAAAPNPQAAADEEQRKLLEAIEAGKRAAGGGPAGSGGIDIQKILDAYKASQAGSGNQPGVAVGHGPSQTVNRGTTPTVLPPRQSYTDPGVAATPGRPNDVITNAFKTPSYNDSGMLGGVGIDPVLNTLLGNGGVWGHLGNNFGTYGYGTGPDYGTGPSSAGFGDPFESNNLTYDSGSGGSWNESPNPSDFAFGDPITPRNLYTGNQMASPEEIEMLLGLIPETSSITPSDRSQFGDPFTVGDLFGGSSSGDLTDADWASFLFGD